MAFWVRDTESVAEFRYFWEDKPMTLWRGLFVGKQRAVYRQLQHAQYSGQTKTHHLILFYAEYLWSLNLNLAGWIAGLKENFLPTVFWFSVSAVVGSISIPRIFQLEYPFPNFSDLVTFSNLMFACRRSGFTKPGFSILRVFSQNMKWNLVFPLSSLSTWGPHGVASCKLGDSVRKAWSTWHSQSLPRTSKSRSILSFWTWHITVQHSFRHSSGHSSRHELIEDARLKSTFRTISNYFELFRTISNYVRTMFELCCWQRFRFKGGVVWVRIGPALQDGPQRSGKANEKLRAIKKKLGLLSAGPRPFTQTLEKPRWDMLNKRELVKLDMEVARLKARFGQTDGLLGTLLIANPFDIFSLHGPMISKSELRKIHRVSVMYCYFIFLISSRLGQPREQLTLCYFIHYWLTATFLKSIKPS